MRVPIHQFKSQMAKYVTQAQTGEVIELTSHRKVVARVIGVSKPESGGVGRLLTAGIATWDGGKPTGARIALSGAGKLVSEMILEDRG